MKVWSRESELLEGYKENTEGLTHCITDYMQFCEENVLPEQQAWINKDIEILLNMKKKMAFISGDREDMRAVQKEPKRELRRAKNKPTTKRGPRANFIRAMLMRCGGG